MKIFQVDSFTDKPFSGNPAGVCVLEDEKQDTWMQNVAEELNLSETAFLLKLNDGYSLRWFTPSVEVDLCGHATLAASHILWEQGFENDNVPLKFFTRSGILTASKSGEWIELDFPEEKDHPVDVPEELAKAIDADILYTGKNRFDYIVEVASEDIVRNMKPDFQMLKKLPARGIIITSKSNSMEYDFISRFFCPSIAIDEDPVTGSAHCCLGPYWSSRLGKKQLTAYQASQRGGIIRVTLNQDRVVLSGQATTIIKGELLG